MTIELANRLAQLRKEKGYSQEELANELSVSRQAVSKWECGEASPDTDNLIALSRLYNISLDELVNTAKADHQNNENGAVNKRAKYTIHFEASIGGALLVVSIIVYILLGFFTDNGWTWGWTLILDALWISSIIEAIKHKKISEFIYPLFVTSLYFKVGLLCENPNWGNFWYVFLTIPLFYVIAGQFRIEVKK